MTYSIKDTLMTRDGMTEAAAIERIEEVAAMYMEGMESLEESNWDDLEELLREEFGLEPDFMEDFLEYLN